MKNNTETRHREATNHDEHPIEVSPYAKYILILAAVVAAICGGLYGYDTGIISGALLLISDDFHLGSTMQEMVLPPFLPVPLSAHWQRGRFLKNTGVVPA